MDDCFKTTPVCRSRIWRNPYLSLGLIEGEAFFHK